MPRMTYEEHLAAQRKAAAQAPLTGFVQGGKKHGAATDPHAPWRDDPSWREHDGWVQESARHTRGD